MQSRGQTCSHSNSVFGLFRKLWGSSRWRPCYLQVHRWWQCILQPKLWQRTHAAEKIIVQVLVHLQFMAHLVHGDSFTSAYSAFKLGAEQDPDGSCWVVSKGEKKLDFLLYD